MKGCHTDHPYQYQRDSKPQQAFVERGPFQGEGSWLAQPPAARSWEQQGIALNTMEDSYLALSLAWNCAM